MDKKKKILKVSFDLEDNTNGYALFVFRVKNGKSLGGLPLWMGPAPKKEHIGEMAKFALSTLQRHFIKEDVFSSK